MIDNTMPTLKSMLFHHAKEAFENYRRLNEEEPSCSWELERRTFLALWQVIKDAGLEEEYSKWKGDAHHD